MPFTARLRLEGAVLLVVACAAPVHGEERGAGAAPSASTATAEQQPRKPNDHSRPSIWSAARSLPADTVHFLTADSALIAGAGAGAALATHVWDDDVAEAVRLNAGAGFGVGNAYGSVAAQAGGALGAVVVGRWTDHDRLARTGLDLLRAQAVTGVWVQTIKVIADRDRPDGSRYSFPSGHAALAFTTAGVVRREYGWKPAIPFLGLATYAGVARVATNHHYLSDVVFGAAMGLASAGSLRIRSPGSHAWQITPMALPGGGGVSCALLPAQLRSSH